MTYADYMTLAGACWSFDVSFTRCPETGGEDVEFFNFDLEDVEDFDEAARYYLAEDVQQRVNLDNGDDEIDDMSRSEYRLLAAAIESRLQKLDDATLAELVGNCWEPDYPINTTFD